MLFPSDYFDIKKVDADYEKEYEAVNKLPEFKPILYNYDDFVSEGTIRTYPSDCYSGACIYRGWMLKPEQYKSLYEHLVNKGITLMNSPEEYNACHLFPEAYKFIEAHTSKSLCFGQGTIIDWELVNKTFKRFMVKDYVKSVKGADFPAYFECPTDPTDMDSHIASFIKLRDNLFTGGIVLKEYVDFKKYGEVTNEYRAFFLKEQLLSLSPNSNQPKACPAVNTDFVMKFNKLPSNYYTVDFGELANGSWAVIENGDGQVSGLSPSQYVFKHYESMQRILALLSC